jgi:hypothetical protein
MVPRERVMAEFAPEAKLVQLAGGSVEQIQQVVDAVESKLKVDPEGVRDVVRPCGVLLQKLLKAQARVEGLLQKLYFADLVKVRSALR